MPTETIGVTAPHHYWLATRGDLPWLTDPDVDDHRPRRDDRDLRDWLGIGRDVAAIGAQLTSGMCASGPDDETAEDDITYDAEVSNPVDAKIIRSWFHPSELAPMADPGDDKLTDGRHRLWACWAADPDLLLPIQSLVLKQAAFIARRDAAYAAGIRDELVHVLGQMTPTMRRRNERYVAALEAARADAVKRSSRS